MISRKSELALRLASVRPDEELAGIESRAEESILGYTRYLNGHRIKIQGNVGYSWSNANFELQDTDNSGF